MVDKNFYGESFQELVILYIEYYCDERTINNRKFIPKKINEKFEGYFFLPVKISMCSKYCKH